MDHRVHLAEPFPLTRHRLGRHIHHDGRSKQFLATRAPTIVDVQHATHGLPLDQGDVGSCTAEATCGALNSDPNIGSHPLLTQADALKLYTLETQMEGKPYPANDPGGSGLMVCKAAKRLGLISAYHHAIGVQHALEALVIRPVITGVAWYSSFDAPDKHGLVSISPGATVRGGHEVVAVGIDAAKQLVWLMNSWGKGFGLGGRFCWSFDTWAKLLADYGDATVPIR